MKKIKVSLKGQVGVSRCDALVDELISQQKIIFALDIFSGLDGDIVLGRMWVGHTVYGTKALYGTRVLSQGKRENVIPSKESQRVSILQRLCFEGLG
jgi:hypothetical protein